MNFVVMDKNQNVLGIYKNMRKAYDNCPDDGFMAVTVFDKNKTRRFAELRIKSGVTALTGLREKEKFAELYNL